MESFVTGILCLLIILLMFSDTQVAAQEGPGIVIAHPGQDVELLCTVTVTSGSQTIGWLVNNVVYRMNALRNAILPGHIATLDSSNLIVQNIMMNDTRNGNEYRCVIIPAQGMITVSDIIDESDPTILYVAGIAAMVPNVTVDNNTININGNTITLTLSWGEPFNNLDPIVNYTVSCSGDVTCPPNFTTTDNTTRSYNIPDLTPMTNYTFSVVATNSIGSGEAGVVMITTPPGNTVTTTITSTESMTTSMTNEITTTILSKIMTTIATTSSDGMTTPSGSVITPITTTTAITPIPTITAPTATTSSKSGDGNGGGSTITIIIVVVIILILLYCCLVFLLFYCCKRKERDYHDKEFCGESKGSFITLIILGVFTFGISILVWYIYVKYKDNDEKDDEYCRIVHVSIIVLGIYTFGTSLLLWWLCKSLAKLCFDTNSGGTKYSHDLADYEETEKSEGKTDSIAYAVSPQALGEDQHTTKTEALQYDYVTTGRISLVAPGTKKKIQSESAKPEQQRQQTAAVDTSTEADKRSSVPYMTTASGQRYALSDKASVKDNRASGDTMEHQGISYAELHQMSDYVNVNSTDSAVPYAEVL